jgi:hypothetical protein
VTGNPRQSLLYRLTYQGAGTWSPSSQPTPITKVNVEALTLALDSRGRLWTAFRRVAGDQQVVTVGHTQPGGTTFTLETLVTGVFSDDLAAVTSFDGASGSRIGVMWSDHIPRPSGSRGAPTPIRWDLGTGSCPTGGASVVRRARHAPTITST